MKDPKRQTSTSATLPAAISKLVSTAQWLQDRSPPRLSNKRILHLNTNVEFKHGLLKAVSQRTVQLLPLPTRALVPLLSSLLFYNQPNRQKTYQRRYLQTASQTLHLARPR
jgi:hypothetical protein